MEFNAAKYSQRLQREGVPGPLADAQAQVLKEALSDSLEELGRLIELLRELNKHEREMAQQARFAALITVLLSVALFLNVLIPMLR